MAYRTSFSPFKTVTGLAVVAFVGVSAFLFSFGYISTDNRSDASFRACSGTGGYAETQRRSRRATGRCVCPNGQVVTPPQTCAAPRPSGGLPTASPRTDSATSGLKKEAMPSGKNVPKPTLKPGGIEKPIQPVQLPVYQ